jgi:Holliday junction resolvasome RuvABC endonuclease subunit
MIILSLDVSTKNIGYAVVESYKKSLLDSGVIIVNKKLDFVSQLNQIKKELTDIVLKWNPNRCVIEEFALFMPGKSSAKTITSLAIYNSFCFYFISEMNIPVEKMNVNTARAALKLPGDARIKKEDIASVLLNRYNIKVANNKT